MQTDKEVGDEIHDLFMRKGLMCTHLQLKNRLDSWLLVTKVIAPGGIKRIAFTSANNPMTAIRNMLQGLAKDKLTWKDDTPYQSPIDRSDS